MVENWKDVTLTYFGANGLAGIARMLLHHGKINYTDAYVKYEEWPELSKKFEMGFVPVLEVNGKQYSQSQAIWFYLARTLQLMGTNIEEEYSIISTINCIDDIGKQLVKFIYLPEGTDGSVYETAKKDAQAELSHFAKIWEKRYVSNGSGKTFFSTGLTLADFFLVYVIRNYVDGAFKAHFSETFSTSSPILYKYAYDLIEATESLKSFFESEHYIKGSI